MGTLTRARRKAFVIIDNRGSRTQLTAIITELDDALGKLQEVNDELMSTLTTEEEHEHAKKYLDDAEAQHQDAINRIEQHLAERKGEPPSVASAISRDSARSAASREAEINLKVKQLETAQLERRLSQEKEMQEMERRQKLQEAQDAQAAAKLRAELT